MKRLLRRFLSRLDGLASRRSFHVVMSIPGEICRVALKERGGRWLVVAHEAYPSESQVPDSRLLEWRHEGAIVVDGFVPVWFEPPPSSLGCVRDEWLVARRPDAMGDIEPLLPARSPESFGAWVHTDPLLERLEQIIGLCDCDCVLTDLALVAPLCAPDGNPGAWIALWIGVDRSLCWWMCGDSIHFACRLRGGRSDLSLLDDELRGAFGCGGPSGWETSPVAVLGEAPLERIEPIAELANRSMIPFPLDSRWNAIPGRSLLAAAAVVGDGVLDAVVEGPYQREAHDRRRAIRVGLMGALAGVLAALATAVLILFQWRVEAGNAQAMARLAPEHGWLHELDSLKSGRGGRRNLPASRYLSEVSWCLPEDGRLLDWSTSSADATMRRHSIHMSVPSESMVVSFGSCLDSSPLFGAPLLLTTEVRAGGLHGGGTVTVQWDVPEDVR